MTPPPHDVAVLTGEWWEVSGDEAYELERELARETPEGHVLCGLSVQAVAVRGHLKDVVFWVPSLRQWALVHLTRHVESNPLWPSTVCSQRWDDLVAELDD